MRGARLGSLGAAAILAAFAGAGLDLRVMDAQAQMSVGKAMRSDASKSMPAKSADRQSLKAMFRGTGGSPWGGRIPAKGWSVATDRRRAKKARNVARNRSAHK